MLTACITAGAIKYWIAWHNCCKHWEKGCLANQAGMHACLARQAQFRLGPPKGIAIPLKSASEGHVFFCSLQLQQHGLAAPSRSCLRRACSCRVQASNLYLQQLPRLAGACQQAALAPVGSASQAAADSGGAECCWRQRDCWGVRGAARPAELPSRICSAECLCSGLTCRERIAGAPATSLGRCRRRWYCSDGPKVRSTLRC